ncbi:PKD domain-containing protein [Ramlibacter monticola]|uniref:PKD domain-containing protein n=1 Tax=Ramlibacter monticola TaxID=1926872 RepID=A0A936Z297_9BURK|nr:PKD domain-containing protein [Ramlibacter monticola]MBL0392501.1 PKD domain-containing protein [Ramlibacter monticola]
MAKEPKTMKLPRLALLFLASLLAACGGGSDSGSSVAVLADTPRVESAAVLADSLVAPIYALDFVAPAASGADLNDDGDVIGKSRADPGCGPFCLPPDDPVVWKGGQRIVLPLAGGVDASSQYPRFINNLGTIAGVTGTIGSSTRAALWRPEGNAYVPQDLGVYPGTSSVDIAGLDDQDRLVGWATLGAAIPSFALPVMWSQATGMADLRALGYPNERPAAMSRGGKVVTWGSWYQLGDRSSVVPLPPLPQGFVGAGSNGSAINDAGDQAHFLVSITSTKNLVYPFRLSAQGGWQPIGGPTGQLSAWGMGSISAGQDVTFTALGTGFVAAGPAGAGQPLNDRISPAYPGATVGQAGPMNASGQILSQVMLGRSHRLVKLTPAAPCASNCLVSRSLAMSAQFVEDPALPGSCVRGGKMYNLTSVSVTVTSEAGLPIANALVNGRFLDDYWSNRQVTGTTDASGVASWTLKGPCGVGAVAFLVENAALGTRSFDRIRGTLSVAAIPVTASGPVQDPTPTLTPTPSAGVAPVAVVAVTCTAGRTCNFAATGSYDPDGSIAAYRWAENRGTVWSMQAAFTRTFAKAGKQSVTLQVTDNTGLSASKKVTFTVPS